MSMLRYYLWLSTLPGVSTAAAWRLLEAAGTPDKLYFCGESALHGIEGVTQETVKRVLSGRSLSRAERILADCERQRIWMVTAADAAYPERLRNIYEPPLVLYGKGRLPDMDDEMAVAMVGTRKASVAGQLIAERIAGEFARSGGLVVSGMANGIDSAAQTGAMKANRPTVAVLGCGVDVCYPPEQRNLYEYLCMNGAVVSEYPPGTRPDRVHFPRRNRIISGLSAGVLVVEAPLRSGSLITAKRAEEQGRDLFAVPGSVADPNWAGGNELLKDGVTPVTRGLDLLSAYVARYPHKIIDDWGAGTRNTAPAENTRRRNPKRAGLSGERIEKQKETAQQVNENGAVLETLTEAQKKVLCAIPETPCYADELAEQTKMETGKVLAALTVLEINGLVKREDGRYARLMKR